MKVLERIRKFVDGENVDSGSVADEVPMRIRAGDIFAIHAAKQIAAMMEQEIFSPPGATPRVPQRFFVFMSTEMSRQWLGIKRDSLIEWLHTQAAIRARALTHEQYNPKSFHIELRIDPTLTKDEFRVQQIWDAPGPMAAETNASATSRDERDSNVRTMFRG